MPRSKTLKLFLIDGEPSGRIKCSLANWTGIAYKIPITALEKCKNIDLLQQSRVYFLKDNMIIADILFSSPSGEPVLSAALLLAEMRRGKHFDMV